jgi:uncharacterized protein YlxW (UPF0749 family)
MITILEGIDYSALIVGVTSLIIAYKKSNNESKSSELSDVKDYYINLVKSLNERNKTLANRVEMLEERICDLESQQEKYLTKLLSSKCINMEEGS